MAAAARGLDESGLPGPAVARESETGARAAVHHLVDGGPQHVELALSFEQVHRVSVGLSGHFAEGERSLTTPPAVCGPNSLATAVTMLAGKPPRRACSRMVSASSASWTQ